MGMASCIRGDLRWSLEGMKEQSFFKTPDQKHLSLYQDQMLHTIDSFDRDGLAQLIL